VNAIPLARPDLTELESDYVNRAIKTSWISSAGEFLERFETEFAGLCGTRHVLAVSNGTVALHLALLGLCVGPGDEVIVPSLTYIASVNAITYVGARPVFVDVDPRSWCLDVDAVEAAITDRTVAIMAVHLYGQPADMGRLMALAHAHSLKVIEDAAEAPLANYRGATTGSLGHVGTFSFYGNKIFTSGEGGALSLDDDDLASRLRIFRGQGMDPARRYFFPVVGYNYRLTNVAAALLCAQLDRRDEMLGRREAIYARYTANLATVPGIQLQTELPDRSRAHWLYSVIVDDDFGISRDELATELSAHGIETRPFFIPIHTLPPYAPLYPTLELPVTSWLSGRGLNLPTFSGMSIDQVDRVCQVIEAAGK
jgi:perosamine synthetase